MIHVTYLDNYESINEEIFSSLNDRQLHPQDASRGHLIYSDAMLGMGKMSNVIVDMNYKLLENEIRSFFKKDLTIIHSWLLKTDPGGYSTEHHHGNLYSGVYYVKAEKNQGVLRFVNYNTKETIDIEPRTGNIIFFGPKPLLHQVLTNNSNSSRISLSFDLILK